MGPFNWTLTDVQLFLLAFFRVTGLMLTAPFLGSRVSPPQVKVWFSFLIAMMVFPLISRGDVGVSPNLGLYLLGVFMELAVGILMGLTATLLFAAVQFGGHIIDMEMGMSLANVLDPVTNEQVSILGQFKLFLSLFVYVGIDGHHFLLSALMKSFQAVPLLSLRYEDGLALHIADTAARDMFLIGIQVGAPALVTLLLVAVGMALIARASPEMNIFAVGFSLRLMLGFVVLALALAVFTDVFIDGGYKMDQHLERLLEFAGGVAS